MHPARGSTQRHTLADLADAGTFASCSPACMHQLPWLRAASLCMLHRRHRASARPRAPRRFKGPQQGADPALCMQCAGVFNSSLPASPNPLVEWFCSVNKTTGENMLLCTRDARQVTTKLLRCTHLSVQGIARGTSTTATGTAAPLRAAPFAGVVSGTVLQAPSSTSADLQQATSPAATGLGFMFSGRCAPGAHTRQRHRLPHASCPTAATRCGAARQSQNVPWQHGQSSTTMPQNWPSASGQGPARSAVASAALAPPQKAASPTPRSPASAQVPLHGHRADVRHPQPAHIRQPRRLAGAPAGGAQRRQLQPGARPGRAEPAGDNHHAHKVGGCWILTPGHKAAPEHGDHP